MRNTLLVLIGLLSATTFSFADDENADSVLYWASSGGGWRSLMADMGYGHAFYKAGLITNEATEFDLVSAVSGGSWFKQQFLYSQPFFERIITDDPDSVADFALEWLGAFATGIPVPEGPDDRCEALVQAATAIPQFALFAELCNQFAPVEWDFAALVQKMLNDTSNAYGDPGFSDRTMTSENRISAMKHADFYVQLAVAANSRIDADNAVFLGPADNPTRDYSTVIPAQYVVKDASTYYAYGVDDAELPFRTQTDAAPETIDTADWVEYNLFPPPVDANVLSANLRENLQGSSSFRDPFGGGAPTVSQIAAATSSATADISPSVPSMFAQRLSQIELGVRVAPNVSEAEVTFGLDVVSSAYNSIWQIPVFNDFAICSQWPEECGSDDSRLVDGGHADFLGVAQTIGQYQVDGEMDKTLKVVITNNNNRVFGNTDFLSYFNAEFYEGVEPGEFYWPIDRTGPFPTPRKSIQIFEEFMDEETLLSEFVPIEGTDLTSAVFTATTIDNPDFKVQAGMQVEILLLQINSDIQTFFDPSELGDYRELTRTIASSDELVRRVQDFASPPPTQAPTTESEDDIACDLNRIACYFVALFGHK